MKCFLGVSDFLEDISSLFYSIVFLYFFAVITEEGFLIPKKKKCKKTKMAVGGGLTNSCKQKRSGKERRKRKI